MRILSSTAALLLLLGCPAPVPAQTKEDVPDLVKKLKSSFSSDREAAAQALAKLGPDAQPAVKPLVEAMKTATFASERVTMINALVAVGAKSRGEVVPALVERLKVADFADEPRALLKALQALKCEAKEVVPGLAVALGNVKFSDDRIAVAKYLGTFGAAAQPALPALIKGLKAPFSDDRVAVCQVLGGMGAAAKGAMPALTEMTTKGPFEADRKAAAAALKVIQDAK